MPSPRNISPASATPSATRRPTPRHGLPGRSRTCGPRFRTRRRRSRNSAPATISSAARRRPVPADTTLAQQQLADLSAELTKVRTDRADAETKAAQIRSALKVGSIPNVSEVLNSALVQNLIGQAVALKSQRAQLNATLLPGHPKMQELNAQIVDLDRQIVAEASKIVDALESDASLAKAREAQINGQLGQLKTVAATVERRQRRAPRAGARGRRAARPSRFLSPPLPRGAGARADRLSAGRCPRHFARRGVERAFVPEEGADDGRRHGRGADPVDRLRPVARARERPADAARSASADASGRRADARAADAPISASR